MIDDFLLRALLASLGVALVAGPLGCFIVWRRMAYFGDSLAHSALLGVALGFLLGLNLTIAVAVTAIAFALLLLLLQRQRQLASDTLLGILAHSGLAIGLVVLSFFESVRLDLMVYLFGDVLAVTSTDLLWIYGAGVVALAVLVAIWRPLLFATLDEELARAEGIAVGRVRMAYMLVIALVIAVAMKVVGILLITSMLIIPAATARRFAQSPEHMAALSVLAGALAVTAGLAGSLAWDTPAGPSIVAASVALLVAGLLGSAVLPPVLGRR